MTSPEDHGHDGLSALGEGVARQSETDSSLYAIVVVHTELARRGYSATDLETDLSRESPLARTWHYTVPAPLRPLIRVGQLVWVPFGRRYLQGIVVGLDSQSPVEKHRDIDQIVDLEPILSSRHIELARWISEYYIAPMYRVVLGMLPPGMAQTTETIVAASPNAHTEHLTELRREIMLLLQQQGEMSLGKIRSALGQAGWPTRGLAAQINSLTNQGQITKQVRIRPPSVRPKLSRVVRLRPGLPPNDLPGERAARQAAVVRYLAERRAAGEEWVPVSKVYVQTSASSGVLRALLDRDVLQEDRTQVWRDPLEGRSFVPVIPPPLLPGQERVWVRLRSDLDSPGERPFLLQGVTGSGKTEIYLRAARHVLAQGRGVIILVPEIALTPQTIRRFGARFPTSIAVLHSGLSAGERYDQWRRIRAGELRLVVGARSAIFAPISGLGLIVLDEEHEWSYKQQNPPRYHTRDVAIHLARLSGATCILGSATPALESAYSASRDEFVHLRLPDRIMGHRAIIAQQEETLKAKTSETRWGASQNDAETAPEALYAELPPVKVVDMRAELRAGNTSMLSQALQEAIRDALGAQEQIILFLNRRGSATFVLCRDCGHVLTCPRCDVPLTHHAKVSQLVCHHCSYRVPPPSQCPNCWSKRIRYFGAGTQRVEEVVTQLYPQARIVRWDLDTTGGKQSHEELLDRFIQGEADIMIGTQMIAKGLDLPRVTLVGVITADTMLNLPDLRASERTFQILTQVAGRAGRSILGGQVIIQTYTPEHPAIQAAEKHDYEAFYRGEIAFRRQQWYPPLSRLIRLVYVGTGATHASREANTLYETLNERIARMGLPETSLIGPAPCFYARVRGKYRWHILVRGSDPHALIRGIDLPLGWRVDVDPVSLL